MECSEFYQDRIKFGLAKKYICLLRDAAISIYDPVDQSIIMHTRIPPGFQVSNLYSYIQGAQIPIAQNIHDFACCASPEGLIYIAGGYVNCSSASFSRANFSHKAAVYKVDEDEWDFLPDMHYKMTDSGGVFYEGMFYVISSNNRTQRFDPNTRVWTILNLSSPIPQCVHVMFGRLIAVIDNKIEQYDWEKNVWIQLETLPKILEYVQATEWSGRIFMCGHETTLFWCPKFYMHKFEATPSERWVSVNPPLEETIDNWISVNASLEETIVESIITVEI
ncbi:F-box/kelch-repeat protein At5g60570-like [Cryptomeria japonica]|uniref:F-box/kelch-repeat protein At5g60570-like n=1 Tax=Cryptomeria japonica TaxID=3369 RepID=UPI0025AD69BA|nr:F-box/kelch-repeat protein At5g60570-like [Cryptomeria japonica]